MKRKKETRKTRNAISDENTSKSVNDKHSEKSNEQELITSDLLDENTTLDSNENTNEELNDEINRGENQDSSNITNETLRKHKKLVLNLKPAFEERYRELLKDRYDEFVEFTGRYIRKSIRVNTLKISVAELKQRLNIEWELEQVPWCEDGFWINYRAGPRFDIGNLPEHQLGFIYVQDASSMIPPVVLSPSRGDVLLDLCAAPGSKTTQLAQYMQNEGLLIANDSQGSRLSALGINLQRCGVLNVIITKMDGERLTRESQMFDKILVDAPCSGTGTIRRNYKIAEMWSPGLVKRMASIQYRLLKNSFNLLKTGGELVYSTCTLEPEEDEEIVDKLLKEFPNADVLDIKLNIKRSDAITTFNGKEYDSRVKKCLRIYPQDNDSEGFFVAKIKKN